MKRILITLLIVMFFFNGLRAQWGRGLYDRRSETHNYLTASFGPAFCFSDTQGSWMNQINLNNYNLSFGYRRLYANNFGFKASLDYSAFTGNDKGSKYVRQYSYSSNVIQASFQAEYTILIGSNSYNNTSTNAIYGFVGAGVFRSDANLKGVTTPDYIPISHYQYKKNDIQPIFPYGIGYQYYINTNILIGFEAFGRYPLSDFIDGFKPPQTISKNNDVTGGVSLTVSFLLGSEYLKRN